MDNQKNDDLEQVSGGFDGIGDFKDAYTDEEFEKYGIRHIGHSNKFDEYYDIDSGKKINFFDAHRIALENHGKQLSDDIEEYDRMRKDFNSKFNM